MYPAPDDPFLPVTSVLKAHQSRPLPMASRATWPWGIPQRHRRV